MQFNESSIPGMWYDAVDDLIDHNRHRTDDIVSAKWWLYRLRYEVTPITFAFQLRFWLTLAGTVNLVEYYAGRDEDSIQVAQDAASIHDDLAIHMANYAEAQIQSRGCH